MNAAGFFWHPHHGVLLEWSDDIGERIKYIEAGKPESERAIRLRLLQPVRGPLPKALVKARAALDKAWAAYDKARAAYNKALAAYNKARADCNKARADCNKAMATYAADIDALHAAECPDCPWDGKTIFPDKRK